MLQEAYDLLEKEYQKCFAYVQKDKAFAAFAKEKRRHSFQVAGAGNYLLRHIEWMHCQTAEFVELVKTAIFLHDICRFAEICKLFDGVRGFDHGEAGAKFLQSIPMFNDIRIWLPIKHHGHLINALYDDEVYQSIKDKELQAQVQKICFIIRDADKIANLNMVTHEDNIWFLFFGKEKADYNPAVDGAVSELIQKEAFEDITVSRKPNATVADRSIGLLSWFTDINYQAAIDYCKALDVISRLVRIFEYCCSDGEFKQRYLAHFEDYLAKRQYLP
ncbi:MAG: HD domain-containing protein [Alphaproteobacteria bacterium]|jgi:hypothetical protein|nr:HD domain-containing protein [Alphaproteobacteria bacterium]